MDSCEDIVLKAAVKMFSASQDRLDRIVLNSFY